MASEMLCTNVGYVKVVWRVARWPSAQTPPPPESLGCYILTGDEGCRAAVAPLPKKNLRSLVTSSDGYNSDHTPELALLEHDDHNHTRRVLLLLLWTTTRLPRHLAVYRLPIQSHSRRLIPATLISFASSPRLIP